MPKGQGQSISRDSSGAMEEQWGKDYWNTQGGRRSAAKATCKLKHCFSNLTVVQNLPWCVLKPQMPGLHPDLLSQSHRVEAGPGQPCTEQDPPNDADTHAGFRTTVISHVSVRV